MPGRFTDAELDSFMLDPHEPAAYSRCPFCGADLLLGVRKDSRNVTLAHGALSGPDGQHVSACPTFDGIAREPDVIARLVRAGAMFERLV